MATVAAKEPLKIWVLPVGHGDSIVIRLPGGIWGIVDSNFVPGTTDAAALRLLESVMLPSGEKLGFACITHYHTDHFSGLSQILANPNIMCRPKGYFFHNGFQWAEKYPEVGWQDCIDEINKVKNRIEHEQHPFKDWPANPDLCIKLSELVSIKFIAPTPDRYKSLFRTLLKMAQKGSFAPRVFNRIGIAFLLKYGDAVLLFTDDIEGPMWRKIMKKWPDLTACWIKVSHHGARNGNPRGLWRWLARGAKKGKKPHAVISADGISHPSKKVVLEIKKFARLHTTYSSDLPRPSTPMDTIRFSYLARSKPFFSRCPSQTWLRTLYERGRVCSFSVFPDGEVYVA